MKRKRKGIGCLIILLAVIFIAVAAAAAVFFISLRGTGDYGEIIRRSSADSSADQDTDLQESETEKDAEESSAADTDADTDTAGAFYYSLLNKKEQEFYRQIYQGVAAMKECVELKTGEETDVSRIYNYVMYDCPELFWCTGASRMSIYSERTEFYAEYTCSADEKERRQEQIDAAAAECIGTMPAGASEYDQIRHVYEYLIRTVDYDMSASDNQNIYSALAGKRSVCAGYSRAAQYLLNKRGIECIYVLGTSETQASHAWNIVNCDGKYYQMDVTYADPVFYQEETGTLLPDEMVNYDYLCTTDDEMMRDHIQSTDYPYPSCNSGDLDYYVLNGMYHSTFDENEILSEMEAGIYAGEEMYVCKFGDRTEYENAMNSMVSYLMQQAAQTLAQTYGKDNVRYSYINDDVHYKITVIWDYQ